jgi:hypothetical protein
MNLLSTKDRHQEHSNTLHENILVEGSKFCKHKKWSHHINTHMVFGTQQKLLLGGGREDFMVFYKIHTKTNISRERNNRFCHYYTNLIGGGRFRLMEAIALPTSVNRFTEVDTNALLHK